MAKLEDNRFTKSNGMKVTSIDGNRKRQTQNETRQDGSMIWF